MLAPASPQAVASHPTACAALLSPEPFAELCQANPDAVLELSADGSLILKTPHG